MQENENLNPEELNVSNTTPSDVDKQENVKEPTEDDFNIKTYLKVTPTLYIKAVETDDPDSELFRVLNPETQEVETRELNDDEKKELYVKQLKESRKVFKPVQHNGKTTTNQFGLAYRQKRKRRNKLAKASRKANR
jgi:hypothetical protein